MALASSRISGTQSGDLAVQPVGVDLAGRVEILD
jgi:hypothetical protein